ncbi:DNA-nicking Smr family endonuclease [Novosphingobium kunmingense]|uniref:DNA-nicking Smr family endonuclease n=1 Tax=Novosphingobium kunmingense TaxID=1211806 RepID=A0A2N0H6R5_9SPHN|nr:Smr/MutS family protein [Novosphingobium kunmingense]PKB14644.1 DNA-nicking Smr family endonuclease [Novosphingobium kunmingense]
MSRPPRGLTPEEAELWRRLAQTVKPLAPPARIAVAPPPTVVPAPPAPLPRKARAAPLPARIVTQSPAPRPLDRHGLDSSWERKLKGASIQPDFTLDLHGHTLEAAHARLDQGLTQAVAMGARLVLLITGRPRPAEAADRGSQRGAIRAKVLDWLAAGPHAHRIAAVRGAHPRHGGAGALYIVMKRPR